MKRIVYLLLLTGMISLSGYAQQSVSIGTDQINSNAVLWLQGNGSQGLILPVVTNRTNVTAVKGMVVFDDSDKKVYYNSGTAWVEVGGGDGGTAQTLTLAGNTLSISGGNSVQIAGVTPTIAGQLLQWNGSQWTSSNATAPTTGQVLKWNGTSWAPGTDNTGGASIILGNGQLLTGNGTANAATTITGDVTLSGATLTIANNAVNSAKIADGSITGADINAMSATNGQVLKFNGTTWAPGTDVSGASVVLSNGQILTGDGATNSATTLSGDATLNGGALTIANNAVNGAKIADGSVSSAKIADGTIVANDINNMGATNGQVLQFNGTQWAPATPSAGAGTVTNVSGTGPVSVANQTTTPVISISQANGSTNGFLTSTDWAAFNAKLGPTSTTSGDLTGTVINPTVVGIQGRAISNTVPTIGQVLKFDGTNWRPDIDNTGGGTAPTLSNGQLITGNGSSNAATTIVGDVTLSGGTLTIGNNAVNSTKIADGTIQAADLNAMGASANQVLQYNGTNWAPALLPVSTGTVTSVGLSLPAIFSVTGSPVITSGTLSATLASQTAGTVFAAPSGSAGAPTFRTLAATDIPTLDASKITTGVLPIAQGGTGANSPAGALTNLGAMNNTLNAGEIFVGSATNVATGVAVSGDATLSTAGTLTVASNAINSAKIADGSIVDADVNAAATISGTKINPNFGAQLIHSTAGATISLSGATPTTVDVIATASSGNSTGISSRGIGSSIANYGVLGSALGSGSNYGLYGDASGANGFNYGVYARAANGITNWAGFFDGNLGLTSALGVGAVGSENFGTAGQVLTSAGPGVPPVWSNAGSGFSTLNTIPKGNGSTLVASNIFDNGTQIGIGTITPSYTLDIFAANPTMRINSSGNSSSLTFQNSGGVIGSISDPGSSEDLEIAATNRLFFNTNFSTRAAIDNAGNFGLGTITPTAKLDVISTTNGIRTTTNSNTASQYAISAINSGTGDVAGFFHVSNPASTFHGVYGQVEGSGAGIFGASNSTTGSGAQFQNFNAGNTSAVVNIYTAGTGPSINTNAPIRIFDGTEGAGKVLTSDASGLASWQPAGGGSSLINNPGTRNLFAGDPIGTTGSGTDNAFYGSSAGSSNTSGSYNVLMGTQAGQNNATGSLNTVVGWFAGSAVTSGSFNGNTFIGAQAGQATTGGPNTFIGEKSGQANTTGTENLFVGNGAGITNTNGGRNTILGYSANVSAPGLQNAAAIGYRAYVAQSNSLVLGSINGVNGASANTNVGIGTTTPANSLSVSGGASIGSLYATSAAPSDGLIVQGNVGIGTAISPANRLTVAAGTSIGGGYTGAAAPTNGLIVQGNVGIGTNAPSQRLHVIGNILATGTITPSDNRFKKDINPLDNVLSKVSNINGVSYYYRSDEFPEQGFSSELQIGVIAQELEKEYPELIVTNDKGFKFVDYSKLTPVLLEAIKELKKQNDALVEQFTFLKSENQTLKTENGTLESKVATIEAQQKELAKSLEVIKQLLGAEAKK